jgi:hypothetical protein
MYKSVLQGININILREGIMCWEHRVRLFSHYMRYTKAELIEKILELQNIRITNEWTLSECIMFKAYGISPKSISPPEVVP